MKLPTLLLTLLSTAAIAGDYDAVIKPACYVNDEPQYFIDYCPKPTYAPAYNRATITLPRTLDVLSPPIDKPTAQFVDPYPITNRAPAGGLYLIDQLGHGNFNITAPDGGLTTCSSTACFQP